MLIEPETCLSMRELRTVNDDALIEPPLEAENEPLSEFPAMLRVPPDEASHSASVVTAFDTFNVAPDETSSSALVA